MQFRRTIYSILVKLNVYKMTCLCALAEYFYTVFQKTSSFLFFLNNSAKRQSISINKASSIVRKHATNIFSFHFALKLVKFWSYFSSLPQYDDVRNVKATVKVSKVRNRFHFLYGRELTVTPS